ncbi:MAG: hypothetical protein ABIG11_02000 [bacterium]
MKVRKLPFSETPGKGGETSGSALRPGNGGLMHFADMMCAAMWEDADLRRFWRDNLSHPVPGILNGTAGH